MSTVWSDKEGKRAQSVDVRGGEEGKTDLTNPFESISEFSFSFLFLLLLF